jgi:hypothetical protein
MELGSKCATAPLASAPRLQPLTSCGRLARVPGVAFREDNERMRKGGAPPDLANLLHKALMLLDRESSLKVCIAAGHKMIGRDYFYLLQVLRSWSRWVCRRHAAFVMQPTVHLAYNGRLCSHCA